MTQVDWKAILASIAQPLDGTGVLVRVDHGEVTLQFAAPDDVVAAGRVLIGDGYRVARTGTALLRVFDRIPDFRRPYVEDDDGEPIPPGEAALRSGQIDREEADGLDACTRRDELLASASRWEVQAGRVDVLLADLDVVPVAGPPTSSMLLDAMARVGVDGSHIDAVTGGPGSAASGVPARPEIPAEILERAEQVKADRPPTRLVYAEDLLAGMVLITDRPCDAAPRGLSALFGSDHAGHVHGHAFLSVLEVRVRGGMVSAILLDEDGEQQGASWHELFTVRVRAD